MALFVIVALDKPDSLDLRMATRPRHLDYMKANAAVLRTGGPLLTDDGAMIGSMSVVEADDRAAVERFAAQDPYAQAGLFASVDIRPWRAVFGARGPPPAP